MNSFLVTFLVVGGLIAIFFYLARKNGSPPDQGLLLLQNQIADLVRVLDYKLGNVDQKLAESTKSMQAHMQYQFGESAKIIKDINQELVRVVEGQKQVMGVTEQLQNLQDILKNPKQRGVLGEYYLETLLKNVMPPGSYKMQYRLGVDSNSGKELIPDAVVFVKDKIIPIDSKFSLENYNRISETNDSAEKERLEKIFVNDLKLRITETAKYIQPEKGTMEFAFMFIPHEAIYYDLIVNKIGAVTEETENLIQRAASKFKVIIVSPTSFLAYLQTVLQGLKAMQIEESAKDIVRRVTELGKHLKAYEEYHNKLGNALGTTLNHYNASGKELKKVDKDVFRITGVSPGITEPLALEKPEE